MKKHEQELHELELDEHDELDDELDDEHDDELDDVELDDEQELDEETEKDPFNLETLVPILARAVFISSVM